MPLLRTILLGLAGLVVVATALSLVPGPYVWARTFDFPRAQIAALGLVVLAAFGLTLLGPDRVRLHEGVVLGLLVVAVAYQIVRMVPYTPLVPVQSVRIEGAEDTLCVVVSNVLMENRDAERWARVVTAERPDVVAVVEVDAWWTERIGAALADYPHRVEVPQENTYGMALYSRFPLEDTAVRHLVEETVPSIWARVVLPSGPRMQLVVVHPRPPRPETGQGSEFRDAELTLVAAALRELPRPALVAGDLNDVAWSRTTRRFLALARLLDPRIGRGLYPTFPAAYPPLRFPLDHVFHSDDLALVSLRRLGEVGSDHLPMMIEVTVAPGAAAVQAPPEADTTDVEEAVEAVETAREQLLAETPGEARERDLEDR